MSDTENYNDDFHVAASNGLTPYDKNYVKILFKPGYAVQTRELNQLQTILQQQIATLGGSLFKSGTPVINGKATFDAGVKYVEINVDSNLDFSTSSTLNIVSATGSTLRGVVKYVESLSSSSGLTRYRVFVSYTTGSSSASAFGVGDTVFIEMVDTSTVTANVLSSGKGVGAKVEKGLYFINNHFILTPEQYVAIKSENAFNGFVIFQISESYINSDDDSTLLDNSTGSPNYAAIGADRFKIDLTLNIVEELAPSGNVKLLQIAESLVIADTTNDSFSGLNDKLAQRTFEESGNYTVNPFKIQLREAYNNGTNLGRYSTSDDLINAGYVTATGDPDIIKAKRQYLAQLDSSVAYVRGYRIELNDGVVLSADKARSTYADVFSGDYAKTSITAAVSNYVVGTFESGSALPNITKHAVVYDLLDDSDAVIGSTKIKTIEKDNGFDYRLFLYDTITTEPLQNVVKIAGNDSAYGDLDFTIKVNLRDSLFDVKQNTSVFSLPQSPVSAVNSLSYTTRKSFVGILSGATSITLTLPDSASFDKSVPSTFVSINGEMIPTVIDNGGSVDAQTLVITLPSSTSGTYAIIATLNSEATPGTKILRSKTVLLSSLSNSGDVYILPDKHLHAIIDDSSQSTLAADYEIINDGQTSNEYVAASVRKLRSAATKITYEYFEFAAIGDYYSVNSYRDGRGSYQATPIALAFEDFPKFNGLPLYDSVDFRSIVGTSIAFDPYSAIELDVNYYLGRYDKVIVDSQGKFAIIQGKSATQPVPPQTPDDSMTLYSLYVAPYTFSTNDIEVNYVDNRRYTMRDIGSLDKRISNIEYYTALSLLEKDTKDKSIFDSDGERYKNGFIVDSFFGHNIGDTTESDYMCSVDTSEGILRPKFDMKNIPFEINDSSTIAQSTSFPNSGLRDNVIVLPYVEKNYIEQANATETISVAPHEAAVKIGTNVLNPSIDNWVDVLTRPVLNVIDDGEYDSIRYLAENAGVLGTLWNSWETNINGTKILSETKLSRKKGRSKFNWKVKKGSYKEVVAETSQFRSGVETTLGSSTVKSSLGERTVDSSIRPYMRSAIVRCDVSGLKPNTRHYAFFDGIDVSSYVFKNSTRKLSSVDNKSLLGLDNSTHLSIALSEGTNDLTTGDDGTMFLTFVVPSETLKFVSGSKTLRISDSPRNIATETTSFADATYTSAGLSNTKEETILSTVSPEIQRKEVSDARVVIQGTVEFKKKGRTYTTNGCYQDPIAQTFRIEETTGVFLTSVDLYFAGKPTDASSVKVFLVPVENGIPTQTIIPFSEVSKTNDGVTVTSDASTPTTFEFSQPVYLMGGAEYAIVCLSHNPDYKVYIARLGGRSIKNQNEIITAQSYGGVFLTSANSSTWSPDQNADLMFTFKRASFDISSKKNVTFKTNVGNYIDSIMLTNAGAGYLVAPAIIISAPASGVRATAVATLDSVDGSIKSIRLTKKGSGYTSNDVITVSIASPPSGGTLATATATTPNVKVSSFVLTADVVSISDYTSVDNILTLFDNEYAIASNETYTCSQNKKTRLDSGINNLGGLASLKITLGSTNEYVSPIVDRSRLSLTAIENYVNTTETDTSVYVTKQIALNNPSEQVDIFLGVNRPSKDCAISTYIKMYYGQDSDGEDNSSDWIEIKQGDLGCEISPKNIPVSSEPYDFNDVHYKYNATTAELNEFYKFRVKIVFTSANIVDVPTITDFRAIAS